MREIVKRETIETNDGVGKWLCFGAVTEPFRVNAGWICWIRIRGRWGLSSEWLFIDLDCCSRSDWNEGNVGMNGWESDQDSVLTEFPLLLCLATLFLGF